MLPGRDGFELLEYMKKYNIPVIYMTAKTDSGSEVQGLRSGAEDYIVKPFEMVTLLVRIEKVLERFGRLNMIYRFDDIVLDGENRSVTKSGAEVELSPLGLDVVCDLVEPVVFSVNYSGIGYRMEFVRHVNGLPISYSMYPGTAVEENSSGEELWGYERISVYAAKAGIVYFRWENPHTEPVLETEDAKLMAFSDVYDIFGKMIMIKNQHLQAANEANGFETIRNVNVDKVQLSLMRIRDKGNFERGLIVPVWDFYGSVTAHTEDENYKQYVYGGPRYETLLSINAIDGTLIDRELGY